MEKISFCYKTKTLLNQKKRSVALQNGIKLYTKAVIHVVLSGRVIAVCVQSKNESIFPCFWNLK